MVRSWRLLLVALFACTFAVEFDGAVVTNTNDSGSGSLRYAISTTPAGGTVNFQLSMCPCTVTLLSGQLLIDKPLRIIGPAPDVLTVSGNNVSRVFYVHTSAGEVLLEGLKISNGSAPSFPATGEGGGVFSEQSNLVLRNSVVSNNSASFGGGVAIYQGSAAIFDSTISSNTGAFGGGISNQSSGVLSLTRCIVSNNTGNWVGGGIYANGFTNNQIIDSVVTGNDGTAAYIFIHSNLNVAGSTFSNNTGYATIDLQTSSGSFTNSTVSGNHEGYAISHLNGIDDPYIPVGPQSLSLINTTITGHLGGILTGGWEEVPTTVTIKNSIVASGVSGRADVERTGTHSTMVSNGYNLIGNPGSLTVFDQAGDQAGSAASPLDPKLAPLAANGGFAPTHALRLNSPAVDRGASSSTAADQRGLPRPSDNPDLPNSPGGDGTDMGSFEVQWPVTGTVSLGGRVLVQGGLPLRRGLVVMTDSAQIARFATINPFGYYRFTDVPLGRSFTIRIQAKAYTSLPLTVFSAENDLGLFLSAIRQ